MPRTVTSPSSSWRIALRVLVCVSTLTSGASAQSAPGDVAPLLPPPPIDRVVFQLSPGASEHRSFIVGYAGSTERLRLAVSGGPRTPVPKIVGDAIIACAGAHLYEIDAATAVVRRRVLLSGECSALFIENGLPTVRITGGDAHPWTRYVPIRAHTVLPLPKPSLLFAQHQVAQIAPGATLRTEEERLAEMRRPENRAALAAAESELMRREAGDPTNPWYAFELGMIARARRDDRAALSAFRRALTRDRAYDLELLRMVTALDRVDPALADRAFERGHAYLLRHGYAPTLATSGLVAVVFLGVPDDPPLDVSTHYPRLARHARRLARLAPHAEGSAMFYEALRREAAKRGARDDEAFFAARTASSARTRGYGLASWEAVLAGDLVNVMLGIFFALFVLTAFKIARTWTHAPEDALAVHRMSPLARFTRAERVGVLLAAAVFCAAGTFAARGVALIGQLASAPSGLGMGLLGDPETVAYTREMTGTPGGDLIHAIALLGAGDRAHARAYLARSGLPEARRLRAALAEGAALPAPYPPASALDDAYRTRIARVGPRELHNPFLAPLAVFALASGEGESIDLSIIVVVVTLLTVLALLGPYRGAPWPAPARPAAFTASLFLPGAPRAFGALSFLVGGAFVTTVLGLVTLSASDGVATNVLDAIAVPDFARFYGASARVSPDARALAIYLPGVLALATHIVYVAFFARRSDDPARGLAAASNDTAAVSSETSSPP